MQYSRMEQFLNAIKMNDVSNLPIPQSRIEYFLKAIVDGDVSNLPTPQSRAEEYLDYIAKNGSINSGGSNDGNNEDYIFHNLKLQENVINALELVGHLEDNVIIEVLDALSSE